MTTQELLTQLTWRYATKKFDAVRKIPADVWNALEETLVLTPSSFGLQPWKFLVVNDPAVRESLVPHSWGQRQVADASHLVVMTVKTSVDEAYIDSFVSSIVATRGGTGDALKGYRDMMVGSVVKGPISANHQDWAARQAYIALGNLMTAAAMLGLDTCPMEGFVPAEFDKILGLEGSGYATTVLCPVGYRAEDDLYATLPKVRFPKEEVIRHI